MGENNATAALDRVINIFVQIFTKLQEFVEKLNSAINDARNADETID